VFLDPDTGIAPNQAKPEHVSELDLQTIWSVLLKGDLLAAYQHADRTSSWKEARQEEMALACGLHVKNVSTILGTRVASDVAMLWSRKELG